MTMLQPKKRMQTIWYLHRAMRKTERKEEGIGEGNGEGKDDDEQCDQEGGEVEDHDRRSSGGNQEVLAAPIIVPSQPVIETTGITIDEETWGHSLICP